ILWASELISFEILGSNADQFASASLYDLAPRDRIEQPRAAFHVPGCIKQNVFIVTRETRDNGVRRGLRKSARGFTGGNADRTDICLTGGVGILDVNAPNLGTIGAVRDR